MVNFLQTLFSPFVLKILICGAAFGAIFILMITILPDEMAAVARKRLGVTEDTAKPNRIALFRWFHPFYTAVLPLLYSTMMPERAVRYIEKQRPLLQRKLVTANIRDEITPDEFLGFKVVMSFVLFFLVLYIAGSMGRPITPGLWPFLLIGGFFAPDNWLTGIIKKRRREIIRAMPYTLDLLTLSVEAGLDFIAAIQRLTQRSRSNALLLEFGHMLKEIRLGTSRSDSLRSLADRLQIEEISSFTTLLIQADQLGASIGQVLRAQSDQLRAKRFQAAEVAGARASQLVLFPLVLFIFPAIFIIVLGPTVLNFLAGGLFPR
jgi:tight adherence protein C